MDKVDIKMLVTRIQDGRAIFIRNQRGRTKGDACSIINSQI